MSGYELAERAMQLRPELEVIFMSGYGDDVKVPRGIADTAVRLQKPFAPEELVRP